ncbi:hypothetical protein ESZ53_00715 [Salinibacterium sp. UTAS2018]|nr:hypothetical protein ESZ53_00715 [Salinibacterium sp. UTAS2018]
MRKNQRFTQTESASTFSQHIRMFDESLAQRCGEVGRSLVYAVVNVRIRGDIVAFISLRTDRSIRVVLRNSGFSRRFLTCGNDFR